MDFSKINTHLLSYPGATKAFHERWGWMVYWIGGKQFTQIPQQPKPRPKGLDPPKGGDVFPPLLF